MESSSDPSSLKHYLMEELDPRLFLNTYCSPSFHVGLFEQLVLIPAIKLINTLSKGHIKGETLISIPIATVIYPLIPLAEFFNDITVLEMNDVCIKELEKWINTHDEAYDWSHAFNLIAEQEVKSEEWKKREETFKTSVKRILKYDLTKENPTDPVTLPKVDCLYVGCSLEVACKDQDDYIMSMKKISRWLKPGGHLIMYVLFNATFFTVGEHRFRILTLNEEFLKKTLMDIGYEIQTIEMVENKSKHEALNYEHLALITAVMQ